MVTIFTRPGCEPCKATKKKFTELGIEFNEVTLDEGSLSYVKALGYTSAPVIEVDCGEGATAHWSGYRPDHIQGLYDTLGDENDPGKVLVPERA